MQAARRGNRARAKPAPVHTGAPAATTPPHGTASGAVEHAGEHLIAFNQSLLQSLSGMAALRIDPEQLQAIQSRYVEDATQLWNGALASGDGAAHAEPPKLSDRRFAGAEWQRQPLAAWTAATYLLNARTLMALADAVQGDAKNRERVRFSVQQWVDAMAPSNFLALNPEAQRKALDTQGDSLAHGLRNLMQDFRQGHVSQTDESLFEVGRNLAATPGSVVFECPFFQLIEYTPTTAKVHERPILLVPPCINKFYILDLQQENSFVSHLVAQGHRVFLMSWVSPDESLRTATWDDYIEQGCIRAIEEVLAISGQRQINLLGFCVGGTLVTTALAVLAARGRKPAASLTLLTSLLDFKHTGILDIFVDEGSVQMREMTLGPDSPTGGGLMSGRELATTFSFLRPNDLVWNYVVANYLKGETPPPFDLLYWNSDGTDLPGPMYTRYLRETYLENRLCQPGAMVIGDTPVDLGRVDAPVFIYGSREDHIVPWDAAYASTRLLPGRKRFVMGASGHIAGVINPPAKRKRNYWVGPEGKYPDSAETWFAAAREVAGSWWPDWYAWLAPFGGRMVAAPKTPGDRRHPVIEPAPGRYVKRRI